ncbi:MAG: phosphoribosylaminoimidazolesuccinocarboxamide synthase [Nanoarchaeota archaeon]
MDDYILEKTDFPGLGEKYEGKVRDNYTSGNKRIIITTDRISTFDRIVGCVPWKGQVLNQMATFWFDKTKDIIGNHMLDVPDPNVMVVKECEPIMVEMVVREYVTGVTKTSIWYNYQQGIRNFCGNKLPEGMRKDQKLPKPILTPSTKAEKGEHDESVSPEEIVQRGLLSKAEMEELKEIAFKLFERGKQIVEKQGIILVDTKYEFGKLNGKLVLIDEIHTPDSSRFWFKDTYEKLFSEDKEQRKIDKEYVRSWLADRGFIGEGPIPKIPKKVMDEASRRYIQAFEKITGQSFKEHRETPIAKRIEENLRKAGYWK